MLSHVLAKFSANPRKEIQKFLFSPISLQLQFFFYESTNQQISSEEVYGCRSWIIFNIMGTGKKEAARKERQGKVGDGMANVKTKGENFYRCENPPDFVDSIGILILQ